MCFIVITFLCKCIICYFVVSFYTFNVPLRFYLFPFTRLCTRFIQCTSAFGFSRNNLEIFVAMKLKTVEVLNQDNLYLCETIVPVVWTECQI